MIDNLKNNTPLYLIYLYPFSLITGPFLPDFLICLLALFGIYEISKNKKWNHYINIYTIIFIIFFFYILILSLTSKNPLLSLESTLFYFRFIFFSISIAFYFNKFLSELDNIKIIYSICILFVCADAIFQYLFGYNTTGYLKTDLYRLSGLFKDEYILGSYLSRLLPIIIFLFMLNWKSTNKEIILYSVLILLSGVTILLSGERSALFLYLLFIFLISLSIKELLKINIYISILLITITASIFYFKDDITYRLINYTYSQIYDAENQKINFFSNEHQKHFITAYQIFLDKPIVGHGPKMFRELCLLPKYDIGGCSTHPHNTYIQLLSETGIIGFSFVFSFFLFSLYKLFRISFLKFKNKVENTNRNNAEIVVLISIILSLWPLIPTGNFFSNWISTIYFFPLGLYFFIYKKN